MPNWCHNKLAVSGEREAVEAFIRKVQVPLDDATDDKPATALTFRAHVPQPADVESYTSPSGSVMSRLGGGGWYAWRVDHWGTKWDANVDGPPCAIGTHEAIEAIRSDQEQGIRSAWAIVDGASWHPEDGESPVDQPTEVTATIDFETAWSPPLPWLRAVAGQEPQLRFALRYAEPGNDFAGEVKFWTADGACEGYEADLEVEDVLPPEEQWF